MEISVWGEGESPNARWFKGVEPLGAVGYSIVPGQLYELDVRTPGLQSLIDRGIVQPLPSRPDAWDKVVRISIDDFQKTTRKDPPIEQFQPAAEVAAALGITADEFFVLVNNVSSFPRRAATKQLAMRRDGGTPQTIGLWSLKACEQWCRDHAELGTVITTMAKRIK